MRNFLPCIGVCILLGLAGCIEQKMTITSEPAGALVYVSNVEVGHTPLTIPFNWTGDYEVILRHEGYQTLKTHANIKPRAYQVAPLDFFAEITPYTFRDHRYLHFKLETLQLPTNQELVEHAKQMRQENLQPPK